MHPLGHVSTRARKLRDSLDRAESAWSDGSPGNLTDLFEIVINDANHLRKALLLQGLPPAFESARFDEDLDERVRHARNIWEHWEEPGTSMAWFKKRYPDRTPHMLESAAHGDIRIAGVFTVSELRDVLDNVKRAFALHAASG